MAAAMRVARRSKRQTFLLDNSARLKGTPDVAHLVWPLATHYGELTGRRLVITFVPTRIRKLEESESCFQLTAAGRTAGTVAGWLRPGRAAAVASSHHRCRARPRCSATGRCIAAVPRSPSRLGTRSEA